VARQIRCRDPRRYRCGRPLIPLTAESLDPATLRQTFGCFPSGVTAVCGLVDGLPVGMAASSFTSVSLDPPLVSVCVANSSSTWPLLRSAGRIGVSVLGAAQETVSRQLSSRAHDRFAGVAWEATPGGAVVLHGAPAVLECALHDELPAGDHQIVLLRVEALSADPDVDPLVFHGSRYWRLLSERAPDR
jgi:flavin reductase (DIM6/NTAB) family NADH-FMN oxidoreductase RutF